MPPSNPDEELVRVPLRRRSTPYEFVVVIREGGRSMRIYAGRSYQYALAAYWQAVSTVKFIRASGEIELILTKEKQPFGGFITEVVVGRVKSLHQGSGQCADWKKRHWIGGDLAEKIISVIPGTLGLPE